jgi:hypothetical protein
MILLQYPIGTSFPSSNISSKFHVPSRGKRKGGTDLRDTLLVLATVEDSPSYPARVLALEEKGFGLSILEAEDLAVATDVQLTL